MQELEDEGMTRSDAQGAADAEVMNGKVFSDDPKPSNKHNERGQGGRYGALPTHADDLEIPCKKHGKSGVHGECKETEKWYGNREAFERELKKQTDKKD